MSDFVVLWIFLYVLSLSQHSSQLLAESAAQHTDSAAQTPDLETSPQNYTYETDVAVQIQTPGLVITKKGINHFDTVFCGQ